MLGLWRQVSCSSSKKRINFLRPYHKHAFFQIHKCLHFLHIRTGKQKSLLSSLSIQFLIGDGIPYFRRRQKPSQTWQMVFNILPTSGLLIPNSVWLAQVQKGKKKKQNIFQNVSFYNCITLYFNYPYLLSILTVTCICISGLYAMVKLQVPAWIRSWMKRYVLYEVLNLLSPCAIECAFDPGLEEKEKENSQSLSFVL